MARTKSGLQEGKLQTEKLRGTWWEPLFLVILFWYPLRHIQWGLDFWDTGYNYGNFTYMEHMELMWKFSTYLANVMGRFLTGLPGADGLVGMNLYTGIFVSALALLGYWFCTRKLGIARGIAFVGEFAAISLCWCPTALLYNYLTYVLFLLCVILLYIGLTEEKMWCLFAAGACLGANIFVRFSNLPEAALILAVWVYAFLVAGEERLSDGGSRQFNVKGGLTGGKGGHAAAVGTTGIMKRGMGLVLRYTRWCLGGYLSAVVIMLGYLHIRYGINQYLTAILRLFSMTDNATDYKATSMLEGLVYDYVENLYWVKRIGLILLVGIVVFDLVGVCLWRHSQRKTRHSVTNMRSASAAGSVSESVASKFMWRLTHIWFGAVAVLMLVWLYLRGFCSLDYHNYGPIQRPGVLFLMLTMAVAVVVIFYPRSAKEEKLISGLLILVVLLTSIGSNNKNMPSLNNLFVAAPYTLWQCGRFVHKGKAMWEYGSRNHRAVFCSFPLKAVLAAFLAMFLFQSILFGTGFVFAEATGVRDVTATVDNNEILRGVRMSPERAEWMTGISAYVKDHSLQEREVLLYGRIPAMSYYLGMAPAFNSWSDLDSYAYAVMEADMEKLAGEIENGDRERPVVLLNREYYLYMIGGEQRLQEEKVDQSRVDKILETDAKNQLVKGFIEGFNYDLTYEDGKFALLE